MNRIAQRGPLLQKLLIGVLIASFFAAALYLRVALPYKVVFGGNWVKFTGVDAYYHVRIVENLVHHFPHLNAFDPYMLYPGGMDMATSTHYPFFDYLVAGVAWIIGLGSPSQHTIDVVCAYFPAILGALVVVPVYFIGKTLVNRWAGVVAAGLIAISPGDFLGRSILGFTDHHIAEALFAATTVMFLVLSIKNAKREPLTLAHFRHPGRAAIAKPMLYAGLAGVFLGIYLITWMGALLFAFIFTVFLVVQFVIDHLKGTSTDYLCLTGTTTFLVALVVRMIVPHYNKDVAALVIAFLAPLALYALSRLMSSRGLRPIYYPLAVVGLVLVALGLFRAINYPLLKSMWGNLDIFAWQSGSTIMEMQPLLLSGGDLTFSIIWQSYEFSLLFAIAALGLLVYWAIRRGEAESVLVVVWTLTVLAAALAQRRFAYYLSVNVAVLAGYASWQILRFAGLREEPLQPDAKASIVKKKTKPASKRKPEKRPFRVNPRHLYATLTAIAIFSLFFFPTIGTARNTAKAARFAPSDAWCESLTWLRENTPEPFDDPDFYYTQYATPFEYSNYPNAYGVTSWWDYGYWIVRIGHRIPTLNPSGQPGIIPKVANFMLAQDEASAVQLSEELGSKYVILDNLMALAYLDMEAGMWYGKFAPMVSYTDHQDSEFFDVFYQQDETTGGWSPVLFYLPGYYRSLCVRLYWFGGEAVEPSSYRVISYEERLSEGMTYNLIRSDETFSTYEEALIEAQKTGEYTYRIVSGSPDSSAVPLEELQHYQLVHDAGEVRIFEYAM